MLTGLYRQKQKLWRMKALVMIVGISLRESVKPECDTALYSIESRN